MEGKADKPSAKPDNSEILSKIKSFSINNESKILIIVLLFSLLCRILLFPLPGYSLDLRTFQSWFITAANYGPRLFYEATWSDYPPLNVYIFWFFGSITKMLQIFGSNYANYIVKLPPNLFDIGTSLLIFKLIRAKLDFKNSLFAASAYAFNPSTIFNGAIWGQYDAIYTFFLILSVLFILRSQVKLSTITFTLAVLTKPQSIALAPLIIFLILTKYEWKEIFSAALVAVATIFVVILPMRWENPISFLTGIYFGGYSNYPYTSLNAFNLWALAGFWRSDAQSVLLLNYFSIGWLMFAVSAMIVLSYLYKKREDFKMTRIFFSSFLLLFSFFMLPTRIHERYLFPAFAFLCATIPFIRKARIIYAILTFTYLGNLVYALSALNSEGYLEILNPLVWVLSSINIAIFLYSFYLMFGQKVQS